MSVAVVSGAPVPRRSEAPAWAWLLWVAAVVALAGAATALVWQVHERAQAQLDELQPRHARLLGLAADRARFDAAGAAAAQALSRLAYPAARDVSQAGNDAQQRVRELFTKAGLDVLGIQLLAAKTQPAFDRIPMTLRVEGDVSALQAALAALPSLQPGLYVEGFNLQGASGLKPDGPARVVAQLELFVLRLRR